MAQVPVPALPPPVPAAAALVLPPPWGGQRRRGRPKSATFSFAFRACGGGGGGGGQLALKSSPFRSPRRLPRPGSSEGSTGTAELPPRVDPQGWGGDRRPGGEGGDVGPRAGVQAGGRGALRGSEGREVASDVRSPPSAGAAPPETAPCLSQLARLPPAAALQHCFPRGGSFPLCKAQTHSVACVCGAVCARSGGEGCACCSCHGWAAFPCDGRAAHGLRLVTLFSPAVVLCLACGAGGPEHRAGGALWGGAAGSGGRGGRAALRGVAGPAEGRTGSCRHSSGRSPGSGHSQAMA